MLYERIGSCKHILRMDLRKFGGRIFFVTDVHGHYDLLHEELRNVAFNSATDILLSAGDWTDRGPDSKYVLDYLNEPWIYTAGGNHEALFVGAVEEGWQGRNTNCLLSNGGMWVADLSDTEEKAIYETFKELPVGIELLLPHGRKVGIVHAEVPYRDWDQFVNITSSELEWNGLAVAQWSRTWYDKQLTDQVKGVDFVLCGHTPTDTGDVEQHGNMIFADGGSFFRGKVNLIEINDEFMRGIK